MSEPKLILKVELSKDNKMKVTCGTRHEALLALAVRKAELTLYDIMISNEVPEEPVIQTEIPHDLITKL